MCKTLCCLPIPTHSHLVGYYTTHYQLDPYIHHSHLQLCVLYEIPVEHVIGFFQIKFNNHKPLTLMHSLHGMQNLLCYNDIYNYFRDQLVCDIIRLIGWYWLNVLGSSTFSICIIKVLFTSSSTLLELKHLGNGTSPFQMHSIIVDKTLPGIHQLRELWTSSFPLKLLCILATDTFLQVYSHVTLSKQGKWPFKVYWQTTSFSEYKFL